MIDLPKQLRETQPEDMPVNAGNLMDMAADEIERLETEYLRNKINAAEYRRGMKATGFSDWLIDETLFDLDDAKEEMARQRL